MKRAVDDIENWRFDGLNTATKYGNSRHHTSYLHLLAGVSKRLIWTRRKTLLPEIKHYYGYYCYRRQHHVSPYQWHVGHIVNRKRINAHCVYTLAMGQLLLRSVSRTEDIEPITETGKNDDVTTNVGGDDAVSAGELFAVRCASFLPRDAMLARY